MKISEALVDSKVAYEHSNGDVEFGRISSCNSTYVFVKFYEQLERFGWEGTTSKACRPEDLTIMIG